jgi:hypothetical protein
MILSRILMVLALAVLAYLVYITMNGSENFKNEIQLKKAIENKAEKMGNEISFELVDEPKPIVQKLEPFVAPLKPEQFPKQENLVGCGVAQTTAPMQGFVNNAPKPPVVQHVPKQQENFVAKQEIVYDAKPNVESNISYESAPKVEKFNNKQNIKYEKFADVSGIADTVHGAAPFGAKPALDESDFATVKFTGLVDGNPGDVIQIEGTDLLTAPLVDNMLYTNSIANTNRNASQDLRGDIPLQFNESYTPFYSSVIYGAPLSQKQMTIGSI